MLCYILCYQKEKTDSTFYSNFLASKRWHKRNNNYFITKPHSIAICLILLISFVSFCLLLYLLLHQIGHQFLLAQLFHCLSKFPLIVSHEMHSEQFAEYTSSYGLLNSLVLAPVVQTFDSTMHWINRSPVDKYFGNQ